MEWIQDAEAAGSPPDEVSALLARAATEASAASADVWLRLARHVVAHAAGIEELKVDAVAAVRDAFERALAAVGLHVDAGSRVWEAYAAFEVAVADALATAAEETAEELGAGSAEASSLVGWDVFLRRPGSCCLDL